MKKSLLIAGILTCLPHITLLAEDQDITTITADSSIEDIRAELQTLDMPLLEFSLTDGAFPTFEVAYPPAGCMGISITGNEYVDGSLTISRKGQTLYESGEYVKKTSGVRLKVRGNTSAASEGVRKYGYKVKLSKKADLLSRNDKNAKDKDWVLLGTTAASMRLNNIACPEIGRALGLGWQPCGEHVNVIINDTYMGCYFLAEAVSAGSHRVDIADTGYIIEDDAYFWKPGEVYFQTSGLPANMGWTFKEPDTDDFTETTLSDISSAVQQAEDMLCSGGDASQMMDMPTFAAWMLAHDLMGTADAAGSNIFVVKDDYQADAPFATKLRMGPLWDFDSANSSKTPDTWAPIHTSRLFYMPELFKQRDFVVAYKEKWAEVEESIADRVDSCMDSYLAANPDLDKAFAINQTLGKGDDAYPAASNRRDITDYLKARVPVLHNLIDAVEIPAAPSVARTVAADGGMQFCVSGGIIDFSPLAPGNVALIHDIHGTVIYRTGSPVTVSAQSLGLTPGSVVFITVSGCPAAKVML